jgi:hypothetical protein
MDGSAPKKRVLILGGGFGGVDTTLHLERLCKRRLEGRKFGKLIVRVDS